MSIQTLRAILSADPATMALVGDKIGPLQAIEGDQLPYIVLAVTASEPYNMLQGFAGLNRSEIEMTAWAANYKDAVTIAAAARAAVEATGNYTIHEPGDETAFQGDVVIYAHRYVFQIYD